MLFPRLLSAVQADHVFAVVEGDGAFEPAWQQEWDDFLSYWIYELKGERYEASNPDSAFASKMTAYKNWIVVNDQIEAESEHTQSVQDFISCQHSRDTFTPAKLGSRMMKFDAELAMLLSPYVVDDSITYRVRTRLTWGSIKRLHTPNPISSDVC